MDFLRELIKMKEGFMPDFETMTDVQLVDLCRELEMEDACELDAEGRIVNREALIRDLQVGRGVDADIDTPMDPREDVDMSHDHVERDHDEPYQPDVNDMDHNEDEIHDDMGEQRTEGTKHYTNLRKKFDYFKPVKMKKAKVIKESTYKKVPGTLGGKKIGRVALKEDAIPVVKFKNPYNKLVTPAHGGLQKDVDNKSAEKAIEDEIGNDGMKGMKKKDRPYMEKPRFRDWLTANMVFNMTKSGELAGNMKLSEGAGKKKISEAKLRENDPFNHQSDVLAQAKHEQYYKKQQTNSTKLFRVHIPANIYDGKYYDYRTVPISVAARTPGEANSIVNLHKPTVLELIAAKRMRSGQRTVPYVKKPAAENVHFQNDYYSKPMTYGSVNALTKDGKVERFEGEDGVWARGNTLGRTQMMHYKDVADENEEKTKQMCEWFARCKNPATGTTPHPTLGKVPTCDRCHEFATDRPRTRSSENEERSPRLKQRQDMRYIGKSAEDRGHGEDVCPDCGYKTCPPGCPSRLPMDESTKLKGAALSRNVAIAKSNDKIPLIAQLSTRYEKCKACSGEGEIKKEECSSCKGTGRTRKT